MQDPKSASEYFGLLKKVQFEISTPYEPVKQKKCPHLFQKNGKVYQANKLKLKNILQSDIIKNVCSLYRCVRGPCNLVAAT